MGKSSPYSGHLDPTRGQQMSAWMHESRDAKIQRTHMTLCPEPETMAAAVPSVVQECLTSRDSVQAKQTSAVNACTGCYVCGGGVLTKV